MSDATTRERIVQAADQLFYERGYEHTSFADIADAVRISRGNFYYHFKSKDEILDAVIAARVAKTERMLAAWEGESADPAARILSFIRMLVANRREITQYGCPVGTLCAELAKLNHVSRDEANALFTQFRAWLRRQFELLGCGRESDALAMHLLARSQGVAALANAFEDETFIAHEVTQMRQWLAPYADRTGTRRGARRPRRA